MHDAGHLVAFEHAAGQHLHQYRGGGSILFAHEDAGLGDGQVDAGALDRAQALNGARQLAFERALVIDLLLELGQAQPAVVHQLEADVARARQALRGQPQPHFVHLVWRH